MYPIIETVQALTTQQSTLALDTALHNATRGALPMWASEALISLSIIISTWVLCWLFHRFGVKLLLKIIKRQSPELHEIVVHNLRTPLALILFIIGVWFTVHRLIILKNYLDVVNQVAYIFLAAAAGFIFTRISRAFFEWYALVLSQKEQGTTDTQFLPSIRRVINALIWLIAFIMVLDYLNIKITSLITTLGIGGLAVALALQDSLSNFFSGFYLMWDKPVRVGDFVRLETGQEGFIDSIGWRSTKIRTLGNQLVVIPNSKLAQSIVTNFYLSEQSKSFVVEVGVGYQSDLYRVEEITVQVAQQVAAEVEGADPSFVPLVRYHTFADSNINFRVIFQIKDFTAQNLIRHEFIKALHRRFNEEGISINYPQREIKIVNTPGWIEQLPKTDKD